MTGPYFENSDESDDVVSWEVSLAQFGVANNGNISQTFSQIATGLTNAIRAGPNSIVVSGTPTLPIAHIHINWPRLRYPAALPVLSVILLVLIIFLSGAPQTVQWKSSTLVLLFNGYETERGRSAMNVDTMEDLAKDLRARLTDHEQGRMAFRDPHSDA
jgi:hypothetical protein